MVTFLYYQGQHGSGMQIRASSNRQQRNISTFAFLFASISFCYEIQSCRVSSDLHVHSQKNEKFKRKKSKESESVKEVWISIFDR